MEQVFESILADGEATQHAGHHFASRVLPGDIIFLTGPLGAGKTTFVQGFLRALGHSTKATSPTYTLVETYVFPHLTVHHFDLYRLKTPEELHYLGIEDYLHNKSICLIEWPEKGLPFLPPASWILQFAYQDSARLLIIRKPAC